MLALQHHHPGRTAVSLQTDGRAHMEHGLKPAKTDWSNTLHRITTCKAVISVDRGPIRCWQYCPVIHRTGAGDPENQSAPLWYPNIQ